MAMKYGIIVLGDVDNLVTVLSELKEAEALDVVTTGVKTKPGATQVTEEPETEPTESENPDPWADDEEEEKPAPKRKAASKAKPAPVDDDDEEPEIEKTTDRFGNVYTLNLPEAPECDCGESAAKVRAKARGTGKPYNAWRCAKAVGEGDAWKSKCKFSELV